MASGVIGVGAVPSVGPVLNLGPRKLLTSSAAKLRAIDVVNGTAGIIYVNVWNANAISKVEQGVTVPALIVAVGARDSRHLEADIPGWDLSSGMVVSATVTPGGDEDNHTAPAGVSATFWTRDG